MHRFLKTLQDHVIVSDGGMGSALHQLVDTPFTLPDQVNLLAPDAVLGVHVRFMKAGARLIETNSFGANRVRLEALGLADACTAINHKAVKLAREARDIAGVDAFIAGAMGPSGIRIDRSTRNEATATRLRAAFREQALLLEDRGVDLFVLETFASSWELRIAVDAVRATSSLPIVAQFAVPSRDDWSDADDADVDPTVTKHLDDVATIDADVIGLNCSMGPGQLLPYFRALASRAAGRPLALQPNSGLPHREGGRYVYPASSPAYFGQFARAAADAGARVIGGCCGTTADQIAAMSEALTDWTPPTSHTPSVHAVTATEPSPEAPRALSGIAQRFAAGEFVVSMQVDPPKGTSTDMILKACRTFQDSGHVHAADVNSNPMARLHMDALWMSAQIEAQGLETIAHYTPRDSSLMGIQGNLLGAWRAGVRNVLVITGDPSVVRGEPGEGDVYQTESIGMVRSIQRLNDGRDTFGNAVGTPPNFHIGVAVNPNADDLDLEVARFKAKIDAGAQFAMTQVFFEWSCWERFLERLGGTCPIPTMIAVWPLTSFRLARRLHHEVPGIVIPDDVLKRLEDAGKGARAEGFDLARTMLAGARERAEGAYIIAPFKRPVAALELFDDA